MSTNKDLEKWNERIKKWAVKERMAFPMEKKKEPYNPPVDQVNRYRTTHKETYEEPSRRCYSSIPVLQFLVGRACDDFALAYFHAVRPSCIRITEGSMTSDAVHWRLTVIVDKENIITSIHQEVELGVCGPLITGYQMRVFLCDGTVMEYPEDGRGIGIINMRSVRVEKKDADE